MKAIMCRQCCRSESVVPERKRWSLGRASSQSASRLFSWYLGRWQPGWLSESHTDHTGCPASTPVTYKKGQTVLVKSAQGKPIQRTATDFWRPRGQHVTQDLEAKGDWTLRKRSLPASFSILCLYSSSPIYPCWHIHKSWTWEARLLQFKQGALERRDIWYVEPCYAKLKTHLSLHIDVELLDTLKCQLLFLHQDANGVSHELLGHLQHFSWHGGREQNHLKTTADH